jgi:PAS domain S-box-containing protein
MPTGLSTPLHLAASLLAVAAAVGLALVVLLGPAALTPAGREGRFRVTLLDLIAFTGALAIAIGHTLAGALVVGSGDLVGWLRAAGLAGVAIGLSPRRLATLVAGESSGGASGEASESAPTGDPSADPPVALPAVLVPVTTVPAAALAAVASAVGGVRLLLGGRQGALVGIALLAWGGAELLQPASLTTASVAWIGGALVLAAWLWQVSAGRLQARFVTAFVASMLGVVVLLSVVLGTVVSAELVSEELGRLDDVGGRLADTVTSDWPAESRDRASGFSFASGTLLGIRPDEDAKLREVLRLLAGQDFFTILSPDGRVLSAYSEVPELRGGAFLLTLGGAPAVDRLVAGGTEDAGVITVGGRLVAFGGVALRPQGLRGEEPSLGFLLTGRIADQVWVSREAAELGTEVAIEVGGEIGAASAFSGLEAEALAGRVSGAPARATLTVEDRPLFVAVAPLTDPATGDQLGRLLVASFGDVIAGVEREQARRLFVLALLGGVIAGLSVALLTGRLVAPIRRLTAVAAAVREGDLEAPRAMPPEMHAPDEVGDLGRAFAEMTASLSEQAAQLREAASVQTRLRAHLEALTESMGDALIAVDPDGRIVTFNPSAERLVGRNAAEALGLPLGEVLRGFGPGDATAAQALGAPDSERAVAVQLLLEVPGDGDGIRLAPTAVTAAPVRDTDGEGLVLGRVLVLRDVTREAEIERMKTEFLSNVSHELRTPLTPIKGYAEVLARRDVGPEATRKFADQILTSTDRLERIVGMIVEFAALDSGRLRLQREPTSLSAIVGEVLADWRARHPDRQFRRRLAADLPPVLVDPAMLRRCLDELLDNAVKFSPGGEPVSVTALLEPAGRANVQDGAHPRGDRGGDPGGGPAGDAGSEDGRPTVTASTPRMVRLSVRDHGVGIEPDTAAGVFQDFYQADASETRHFGGLGLGLALVRRIVDGLDGAAAIDSESGVGSTVHLLLPAADDGAVGAASGAAHAP